MVDAKTNIRLGLNQPAGRPDGAGGPRRDGPRRSNRETAGEFRLEVFSRKPARPRPPRCLPICGRGALEFFMAGATARRGGRRTSAFAIAALSAFTQSKAVFAALERARSATVSAVSWQGTASTPFRQFAGRMGFHHLTARREGRSALPMTLCRAQNSAAQAVPFARRLLSGGLGRRRAGMVPFSGMYEALKTRSFDGQSDPLGRRAVR